MKLTIKKQESFSRGELLLRTFFGIFYIILPHYFILIFVSIWSSILTFISFWVILFTGRYPQSFFEFQVGLYRWSLRLTARVYNMSDGYPAFGINATDEYTTFEMPYPERLSRGMAIVKLLFGVIYCALPHIFIWYFRFLWTLILMFLAWWAVLFTGKYPASWHHFNVGTIRWITRVNLYLGFMTDDYPPFSGREDDEQSAASQPAPSEPTPVEPAPSSPVTPEPPASIPESSIDKTDAGSETEASGEADSGNQKDEGDEEKKQQD